MSKKCWILKSSNFIINFLENLISVWNGGHFFSIFDPFYSPWNGMNTSSDRMPIRALTPTSSHRSQVMITHWTGPIHRLCRNRKTMSNLFTSFDNKLTIWPVVVWPFVTLLNFNACKKNAAFWKYCCIQEKNVFQISDLTWSFSYFIGTYRFFRNMLRKLFVQKNAKKRKSTHLSVYESASRHSEFHAQM